MMHRAWSSIVEVPYCFPRSSVKFWGHMALKIVEFDPNWAFPDCNSSLNSPMAMKCCTKLDTAKERCPIVFQGHPSNFKVTRYKTSPILTHIGRFRTIGQSQLSNPSDLPCSTCFEISIWNLVYTFSGWHDMSSLSFITIGSLWPSLQPKVGQTQFLQSWPYKSRYILQIWYVDGLLYTSWPKFRFLQKSYFRKFGDFGFCEVFQAFFLHVLRYQFETWYIHLIGSVTPIIEASDLVHTFI